jgi:hypothetical protein
MMGAMLSNIVGLLSISLAFAPMEAAAQDQRPQPPVVADARGSLRATILRDFARDLRKSRHRGSGAEPGVKSCRRVISYVQPSPSGKDSSWGAICTLAGRSSDHEVMACDDRFVGKFTMQEALSPTREALVEFTRRNCPPGG